jgi:hypothetical protein
MKIAEPESRDVLITHKIEQEVKRFKKSGDLKIET